MARRTFRLLKETDQFKAGALFQEECDDGTQNYKLISNRNEVAKHKAPSGGFKTIRSRDCIQNNPKWFVEVFKVLPDYATTEEIKQLKAKKVR